MYKYNYMRRPTPNSYDNRFGGGFAIPFLLGGLTGGLLAPAFYPRPYIYPSYPMYPNLGYPVYY